MGTVKIPYYVVRERHGKRLGYWQPNARMRKDGFQLIVCGPDGPDAWRIANEWNAKWQAYRKGADRPEAPRWPRGSLGDAYERYRKTEAWARKALRTREDWARGWRYIAPDLGDVAPATVTLDVIDEWYADVLDRAGVREAHRAMKIWRALWQVAAAMTLCGKDNDPSFGIRRVTPQGRTAVWEAHEVVRLIHAAWRRGYLGLACILSVSWDTAFSPVDTRTLTPAQLRPEGRWGAFFVQRAKTGQAAIGTLSRRSYALMRAYRERIGVELLPNAPMFRTRRGAPYLKNSLAEDFRDLRREVLPDDTRKLLDFRRSVAVEARAGGATREILASKLANTVNANAELERTYMPVDLQAVRAVDQARLVGRRLASGQPQPKTGTIR
ncbi:MAG TPA: hypothetical protein VGU24_15250 [Microvirga sp.]|jgi:plasmid stabilization system protein ParE|nr:hypothetical protein [Microvirga sp.]